MWGTLFIVGFWLTITPIQNIGVSYSDTIDVWTDTTSVVLLEFSEPMDTAGLTNIHNYKIYDSTNTIVKIYRVGIVETIDDAPPSPPIIVDSVGTDVVLLQTKRFNHRAAYKVEVFNVKDIAGNVIGDKNTATFYFNGFVPNRVGTPNVNFSK